MNTTSTEDRARAGNRNMERQIKERYVSGFDFSDRGYRIYAIFEHFRQCWVTNTINPCFYRYHNGHSRVLFVKSVVSIPNTYTVSTRINTSPLCTISPFITTISITRPTTSDWISLKTLWLRSKQPPGLHARHRQDGQMKAR